MFVCLYILRHIQCLCSTLMAHCYVDLYNSYTCIRLVPCALYNPFFQQKYSDSWQSAAETYFSLITPVYIHYQGYHKL